MPSAGQTRDSATADMSVLDEWVFKRILTPVKYRRNRGGNMTRRFLLAAAFGLALCASAHAQDYPARPIRIVVPYPAGGSADLLPRIFAEKLGAKWGQAVLVENRPGAGGNIGAEFVYKAEPDGYTLFATAPGPLVVNQSLYRKLAFDPAQFVPVSVMAAIPNVLLVSPRVPAKSVDELIAYARASPGKLNYGSQGNGTTSHLTAELFKSAAGVSITHVPYKGSAPAMSEILPGFTSVAWFGIVAPPKTPAPIAEKLSAAVAEAIRQPDVAKRLAAMSAEPIGGTPAEMAALMRRDGERWKSVIESARVKVD